MKILLCTNVFEVVENGPVKFANLLLSINEQYPQHEVRILTEDVTAPRRYVHKVSLPEWLRASPVSQFVRMGVYHREARQVRREFPFDVLVYNNALVGLWSAIRLPYCVGMINDYKNIDRKKDPYQRGVRSFKESVFRWVEREAVRRYARIIVNSDYLRGLIQEHYPWSEGKIYRLYKGVSIPQNPVPFSPVLTKPVKVLFVKTDYELGGLPVLIQAIGWLPVQVELCVIGPAEGHRQHIGDMCRSVPNLSLRYLGNQPQEAVINELRRSDLFCVPSYKEALGVANLEAMAHGIPVVSTTAGGIPEVLDHGYCGWMVAPGDPQALAQALEECITRPELRSLKRENALQHVQKFDIPTMFDNFLEILAL